MCFVDTGLGIAAGVAQLAGQATAASHKAAAIKQQHDIETTVEAHNLIVENDAANKEAYQATLEGDRAKSWAVATGAGMTGATPGLRWAEQSRQEALSIASAKDRARGAQANYALQTRASAMSANAGLATTRVNPMSAFMDIATSGLSNYGALQ